MLTEFPNDVGYHVEVVYEELVGFRCTLALVFFAKGLFLSHISQDAIDRLLARDRSLEEDAVWNQVTSLVDSLNTGDPYRTFWIAHHGYGPYQSFHVTAPKATVASPSKLRDCFQIVCRAYFRDAS